MKLRYKIIGGLFIFLVVTASALALVLSHTTACPPAPVTADGPGSMLAITYRCYGSPDVLDLEDIAKPEVTDDGILIKVHSASVNPVDWHYMRGSPYIIRLESGLGSPNRQRLGSDFSGTIEAVGKDVTVFTPGDAVFGGWSGTFAEYISVREPGSVARKPENISFTQAAGVGVAGITALQALRDHGRLQPGEHVLINGASGGVGTFAVQIAKAIGAEVTGVCSTRNLEMVRSIGADHVIDYTKENYPELDQTYDLIIDNVGNHSPLANIRVLKPDGRMVLVGAQKGDWFKPLYGLIGSMAISPFIDQELKFFVAQFNKKDFNTLAELIQAGKLKTVIDRRYPLSDTAEAIRYSETGHARGKIIIEISQAGLMRSGQ